MKTYQIIKRRYFETYDNNEQIKVGLFIARGQWADGHLAYSRLDNNGNEIVGDECSYVQLRSGDHCLYMQRI